MRSRLLVLNMSTFVFCAAFAAGCGPGFKPGNDKPETKKVPTSTAPQAPTDAPTPGALGATDENSEPPLDQDGTAAGTRLIPLSAESRELADKLVVGIQLDKGTKKNTLMIVMKDNVADEKPNVELQVSLSTEVSDVQNNSVLNSELTLNPIGQTPVEIKHDQYSVSYKCLNACATMIVDVQRITGETTSAEGQKSLQGFRASFQFEMNGAAADAVLVLKDSSMTAKEKIISATEARLLANPAAPVETTEPQITARPLVTPPPAVPAPAPAAEPAKTPAQIAAEARRALAARINALPNPTIRRQMPNCDRNSPAFKAALAKIKQDVVAARIKAAIAAGIVLTEENKKDQTLFRANEPWFPAGSRCNPPAPTASASSKTPGPTPSPTPTASATARVVEAAPAAVMTRAK